MDSKQQEQPKPNRLSRTAGPPAQYPQKELTEKIIGCAIRVHRELGPGYLEAIYETALSHELRKAGLGVERQKPVKVYYDGVEVGGHRVDILVEGKVVLELKSVETLTRKHTAQVISTLKACGAKVGLLINFDEVRLADGIRRVVF
ncbi:MAG: GxxExxY protein [Phycisphaerae bacterium]